MATYIGPLLLHRLRIWKSARVRNEEKQTRAGLFDAMWYFERNKRALTCTTPVSRSHNSIHGTMLRDDMLMRASFSMTNIFDVHCRRDAASQRTSW